MLQAIRPYFTSGIVLVGASALVVAPISVPPDITVPNISVSTADVLPASLVTDLLGAFNVATVAAGNGGQITIDTIASLPLGLSAAAQAIIDDPSKTPDILNFLANSFLQPLPAVYLPGGSVFQQFGLQVVVPLVGLLPSELQPLVFNALARFSAALVSGLDQLPGNPLVGAGAVGAAIGNLPGIVTGITGAIATLGHGLGQALGGGYAIPGLPATATTAGLAGWLGLSPTVLFATLSAAVNHPSEIPGLASYLAYTLFSPPTAPGGVFPAPVGGPFVPPAFQYSLFVNTFAPIIGSLGTVLFQVSPQAAAALASLSTVLSEVLAGGLAILPDPVNPFLLPTTMLAKQVEPKIELAASPQGAPGVAAAVAPAPQTPIEALEATVRVLTTTLSSFPAGIESLVGAVRAGYLTVPEAFGQLVTGLLESSQAALAPIIGQLAQLPAPIGGAGGVVVRGATALGHVVDEIEGALPRPGAARQSIEALDGDKPADVPKPRRSLVQLNALGVTAPNLFGGNTSEQSANPLGGSGLHHLGEGKTPVKDLINKVLGVKDVKDVKDAPAEAATG